MGVGFLKIRAQIASNAMPLEGVHIKVKNKDGTPIHELITDQSGKAKKISLDAVDKQFSLDSSYEKNPYTSYIVEAEKDGYHSLRVTYVHIFDKETAIQPIVLVPTQANQSSPSRQKLTVGKFAIQMEQSQDKIGPNIEPFTFRILRHVIIPNPITVHLGTPTEEAPNVSVPFIDYVKNAASSEIYATWPKASLKANIYAIITFALNRVFTQWYRGRGFNFDITNSTAYDQYFVYGRTIYESISEIVDEIFNQYVRRAHQIAPFFTAFCNGTTAICDGLSQWGTVTLANQGMSYMQILRYYYPNDIEISETNIVTGTIVALPNSDLKMGSTGLDVQLIQHRLTRIKQTFPAIPAITDKVGIFNQSTKEAVKVFQKVFNLTSDGIVGKSTWFEISNIYVAVTGLASLESEGTNIGIGTIPPNSTLKVGSIGIDVITLQHIINLISNFYPTIPSISSDGVFGYDTANAVIAYQRIMGLTADGVVNESTWNSLYQSYWGIQQNLSFKYNVQAGDTLWSLAHRFMTTVDAIKQLNNLTTDTLYIGQTIKIPGNFIRYTVQSGDTLWLIAQRFGTTVHMIKMLNNLINDQIMVGQQLLIKQ